MIGGSLFAGEFLAEGVRELPEWKEARKRLEAGLEAELRDIRRAFPAKPETSEQVTKDEFIWKVLFALGWTESLREQSLSASDVPDGLLFGSGAAKTQALGVEDESFRYRLGDCFVEAKRWDLPLDRAGAQRVAPATQVLRYLRHARVATGGELRAGILTNGAVWRLYHTGARSFSGEFFEVSPEAALGAGRTTLFAADENREERLDALTLFVLFFGKEAFQRRLGAERIHEIALAKGRRFEEEVAGDLSDVIFAEAFPALVAAIAERDGEAPLGEVRDAALVLLYRLLFILYAEDRELLPVEDHRYREVALRHRVRDDIARRKDTGAVFSEKATVYWQALRNLCRVISDGDPAYGLPPYNGGLFEPERAPLLERIELGNRTVADLVDRLGSRDGKGGRRYLSYRDLSVQQLGSLYERLLEQEVVRKEGRVVVRPNATARRDSGSYYTPEPLVRLIIEETLGPRAEAALAAFEKAAEKGRTGADLRAADPASALLDLKVCDPAMGSGHFLVSLVDYLTDRVIEALAHAHAAAPDHESPVAVRIREIRQTILENAAAGGWTVAESRLDDRHLIRRMVLKRSVHGVDKNPMAVELAKVSLWLHSFTVGAPLSFLDHHLRCGDSLFGSGVGKAAAGASGLLHTAGPLRRAAEAAQPMAALERLTDAELTEVEESKRLFGKIGEQTRPLDDFLSVLDGLDWVNDRSPEAQKAVKGWFQGAYGDPVEIASDLSEAPTELREHLADARVLAREERFLHWELAFPGVWRELGDGRRGGFDAVIGNPPWDRVKLQQVEWFAARRPEIAGAQRASERKRLVAQLFEDGDPLAAEFEAADRRAKTAARIARECGEYPLLSKGDLNLYSLFVERAMALLNPGGVLGLLVPSGIASDKTAAPFFRQVSTGGRLRALYDFENKKVFFPEVHASFKFSVFVAGRSKTARAARCAFYLHSVEDLDTRRLELTPDDFRRVNPNTGTAPVFRTARDHEITIGIYRRLPVLVGRSSGEPKRAWPVRYLRMLDMTNDSHRFRTRRELEEEEGAWRVEGNRYEGPSGTFLPLYEGKMVQAFDHRAASVRVNPENLHRPAVSVPATPKEHRNPDWSPEPQFRVAESEVQGDWKYALGFKDVTAPTNIRTMIAALIPRAGVGNNLPLLLPADGAPPPASFWALAVANLNALVFDFVARQKVQGQHLNWFIVEQVPVVPVHEFETVRFGRKTAAEVIREAVLELTYTAWDMAPFARGLGHTDADGTVLPPFAWDEARRLTLRAKLDAVFFHLYGLTDREQIRYIFSTFPIVERQERHACGTYRSRDLCLAWMNALAAGKPDTRVVAPA